MKNILEYMKILKAAASNDVYPIYSSYLFSDGVKLKTCNNSAYIEVTPAKPSNFKGYVNIFILEEILNMVAEDATFVFSEKESLLKVNSGSFKTTLNIVRDMGMPEIAQPDFSSSIELDEETINLWKYAITYVGRDSLSPLYIDSDGICATDGQRVFLSSDGYNIDGKLSINKKILSFLKEGYSIFSDTKGNINIGFPNGFAVFSTDSLELFPNQRIRTFAEDSLSDRKFLFNVAVLRDCADKIAPIFHGETENYCDLSNKDKEMKVSAFSPVNGSAEVVVNSELDAEFSINFNMKFIKNMPLEYDTFINLEKTDRLIFENDKGINIIMLGSKK